MTLPERSDWLWPHWHPHPAVRVAVTTRVGSLSPKPWDGFNLGLNCGDQPGRVEQARHHVEKLLQADHPAAWLWQVHGKRVIRADDQGNEADGVWTDQLRWPCVVLTADCLPVLLARQDGSAVAAVHAGWRGLQAGIVAEGVQKIAPNGELVSAWLGPAICGQCYQVGDEVYRAFTAGNPAFKPAFQEDATPHHWRFSVVHAAMIELASLGVDDVQGGELCTACDLERFYSYRKEGETGRFASLIWLDS
ncbi:peptidoglycan editing factor PgeF [Alcanivorax sp. DP30]|uniref:peptidoglycan editing factor PgeF n=1 Tax=Alcanivorax sp. DP30 TaxID=2606217 RepID=UPI00136B4502|nr:peptidoglycan editing factor PgeF [Alcanivorax sp. DP30]MZR61372.1 peptidoglycan editing factor PgeF [Alcanivorax sp. DP30]